MEVHILILVLPLFGIVVFWLLPLDIAIPVYLFILLLSGLMYWAIVRAMKKHVKTREEGLIGAKARVMSILKPGDEAQYLVLIEGELWSANSPDILKPGEMVQVTRVDGLTLNVQPIAGSQAKPLSSGTA